MQETKITSATVYVVDDDEAVRDSIQLLLQSVDYAVETFDSPLTFLKAAPAIQSGCLVLDVRMPAMSGLELQQRLKQNGVPIPVIFITGHGDVPMAVQAMQAGAFDFLQKPFRDQDLLDRIGEALAWDRNRSRGGRRQDGIRANLKLLSPREREVLDRVVQGQANKVIAADLELSQRTVEIHRARVMEKMQADSLADLVRMMLIVESDSANS
jgi:two-component system response regulator FixJ